MHQDSAAPSRIGMLGPTAAGLVLLCLTALITILQPSSYAWLLVASAGLGVMLLALAEWRDRDGKGELVTFALIPMATVSGLMMLELDGGLALVFFLHGPSRPAGPLSYATKSLQGQLHGMRTNARVSVDAACPLCR